jgi:hypothetical protein
MSHLTSVRDGVIIPEQVDNIKFQRESPTYRLLVVPPTGANSLTINNAATDSYIEITPNVFNLSRSFLEYDMSIAAPPANRFNYAYRNKPNIQNLNIYTKSGINIVQIDYLNKMIWVIGRKNMKFADYVCRQGVSTVTPLRGSSLGVLAQGAGIGAAAAFAGGSLAITAPAAGAVATTATVAGGQALVLTTNAFAPANTSAVAKRPDGSLVSDIIMESQYLIQQPLPANALAYSVRFPLSDVAETLLALDKDLYLKENLVMKITWEPQTFVGFYGSSLLDTTVATGGATALAAGYTLSNIRLRLAVQTNPNVIKSVMSAVDAGLSIDIPFVTVLRNPVNSTAQNVNVKINSGMGRSLLKVTHSFFNATESANTAFDNSNLNPADTTVPLRINNYYTQLNSQRLSDYNLVCTSGDGAGDDYQWNLSSIKNSAIFNADVYRANWFHEDDFVGCDNNSMYKESQITNPGLPITNEFTWYFFGNTQGNATINLIHHTIVVTRRTLNISPMGVQLV